MPRPYGWTHGEGRYKGLGQVPGFDQYMGTANYFQTNPTDSWTQTGASVVGYNNLPAAPLNQSSSANLDYMNAVDWFIANPTGNPASMGKPPATIGQWLQNNMGLVLVGGIVGLWLFRK